MSKNERREKISQFFDLGKGRFTSDEYDLMERMAYNKDEYVGKSKTKSYSYDGYSSEGKYTRKGETKYTLLDNDGKYGLKVDESYKDDDGYKGESSTLYSLARDILNNLFNLD